MPWSPTRTSYWGGGELPLVLNRSIDSSSAGRTSHQGLARGPHSRGRPDDSTRSARVGSAAQGRALLNAGPRITPIAPNESRVVSFGPSDHRVAYSPPCKSHASSR